jgi:hypothetical protein
MKKIIVIGTGHLVSTVDNGIANTKHHLTESECTEINHLANTLRINSKMDTMPVEIKNYSLFVKNPLKKRTKEFISTRLER